MDDLQDLAHLINALRPWLGELVIVGGWAHRLYRMLPNVPNLAYQPLRTRDADVAFSATDSFAGDMGEALKAAGFREDLAGEHTPPVTWYRLGGDDQGFCAEFLVPLVGSGTKRNGTPDATLTKAGVTAQKLRHVDMLLTFPWSIHLDANAVVPIATALEIRIPNPVSFIVQKLLISTQRPPEKRAQDVLYIHDTLDLFGAQLESFADDMARRSETDDLEEDGCTNQAPRARASWRGHRRAPHRVTHSARSKADSRAPPGDMRVRVTRDSPRLRMLTFLAGCEGAMCCVAADVEHGTAGLRWRSAQGSPERLGQVLDVYRDRFGSIWGAVAVDVSGDSILFFGGRSEYLIIANSEWQHL